MSLYPGSYPLNPTPSYPALRKWLKLCVLLCLSFVLSSTSRADDVFVYSTISSIRGINLTQQTENFLTTSPFATGLNAVAVNTDTGLVYYGSGTTVYRWNPALGSGATSHTVMNDFSGGTLQAPIRNINSTAGSFLDGKWYVGSETDQGYIEDLYELTMSTDGRQVVSIRGLNLLGACSCTGTQLGGFGDVAAVREGADVAIYGSTADITGTGSGSSAGIWKFRLGANDWTLLEAGFGGQMSNSSSGVLHSNVGTSIRTVDKITGAIGSTSLFTTSQAIYDFSGGFNMDFSDAAGTYGAAFHNLANNLSSVFLGQLPPDNEAGVLNTASGAVDISGDDSAGVDDEDAVTALATLNAASSSYSISLQCTAGAYVAAWIDLNGNSVFDSSERNSNYPLNCANGQTVLSWNDLGSAQTGDSYLRIRTSSNRASIASATGLSPDGEVEDHPIRIFQQSSTGSCPAGSVEMTYNATDLPQTIRTARNARVVSTINIPDSSNIVDINVLGVNGIHYAVRDLTFDLEHNGTSVRLYGRACNARNHFNINFDDEASGTPPCPPTDGNTYPPVGSLADFDNQDAAGDWNFILHDYRRRNGGRFDAWSLQVCSAAPVVQNPALILGKSALVNDRDVTVTLLARNSGDVDLDGVRLTDDLDAAFGVDNYTLLSVPDLVASPAGYIVDTSYTGGGSNINLLSGDGVLVPDAEIRIILKIRVGNLNNTGLSESYNNQAEVMATSPLDVDINDLSGNGLDTSIDTDTFTPMTLAQSTFELSGNVFWDTSGDESIAHDGVYQSGESGAANRIVNIIDQSNTNVLATVLTDANGRWQAEIDAAYYNQALKIEVVAGTASLFISEAPLYITGPATDGQLLFTPVAGLATDGLNIGVIAKPDLVTDQVSSRSPNSSVLYSHTYTSSTHGTLNFALTFVVNPMSPVWTTRLLHDLDCDGDISGSESEVLLSLTVGKDEKICLLVDTFVPANAVVGAVHQAHLLITLLPSDSSSTLHGLSVESENHDVTTVVSAGTGRLVLDKTVRNISQSGTDLVSNTAKPGETLAYTIRYRNEGNGPITDLVINDAAPAYTQVLGGSVQCSQTPGSLGCTPGVAGTAVQWDFNGTLEAGESGSVTYSVSVE